MWYSLNQYDAGWKANDDLHARISSAEKKCIRIWTKSPRFGQIPVEIITNDVASGANPWGCTDYLNQKEKIHATGVKVYEFMGKHSCHTKAVLIDDRMSIVGSYNMDMRSTYQDTELMLAVDSKELNAVIRGRSRTG